MLSHWIARLRIIRLSLYVVGNYSWLLFGPLIGETDVLVRDGYYKFVIRFLREESRYSFRLLEYEIHTLTLFFHGGNIQRHCTNIRAHGARAGCEDREKSSWRGNAERKGGLKLSRRISSFLREQPAFDGCSHFFFSSLRISDLSIVSRDFCLVRRSPAPSLHRKLANNSRKREREREKWNARANERWLVEFQSRSSRWRDSQGFLRLEKFPRYPRLPDESSSVPRSIEKRLVDTWLW